MSDEKRNEELEEQEGSPLPAREMMSLLSTSPASGLGGIGGVEPGPGPMPLTPTDGMNPGGPHVQPIGGDEMHTQDGDTVSEPRSETITQSDSASSQT
ncbi:MAG: hypothetical protein QOF45_860 [Gaiellaceae bacterium]|jgi:hypothetical protein|nr:hypothetical protein [Gaiellaceae bacterium]